MPPPVGAITLPSQVIGKAIDLIKAKAWCQGQEPGQPLGAGRLNHARNIRNEVVPLFLGAQDKALINPDAQKFTAYAAIAYVMSDRNVYLERPLMLWETLRDMAIASTPDVAVGGENYLHPIHNLNERTGQTQAAMLQWLTSVQTALKQQETGPPLELVAGPGRLIADPELVPGPFAPEPAAPAKTPKGKGAPRPQPTPIPKPQRPQPKVKTPVKKLRTKGKK